MQVGPSANLPAATDPTAPPRPPERQRDTLEGLLEATLFPAIKPHRASIVDILRVIDETQIGRELLQDFRTLAARGKFPSIDCQSQQNSQTQDARRTHCLLLREDLLTAGALDIGVAPEMEYAPSVVFRLTEIRNVLAADGKDHHFRSPVADATDVRMDPVGTSVRFRAELSTRMMLELRRGTVNPNMSGQTMPAMHTSAENTRATAPVPMPVDNGRPALPARPVLPAPPSLDNVHIAPPVPVRPPRGNEPSILFTQAHSGQARAVPSHPYARPVTVNAGAVQGGQPIGGPRRVLRWAGQYIQAAKDFLFHRRENPGADGRRSSSESSAHTPIAGITGAPDQVSELTSDTTTDADGSPERPIIRVVKPNHRRTPSIRHKREVGPDHVRGLADASPLTDDRTTDRTNGR
jgi:hypothetical protein